MIFKKKHYLNHFVFSTIFVILILSISYVFGKEAQDLNKRLPTGLHQYRIQYRMQHQVDEENRGIQKELILMGSYHSMPMRLFPKKQCDALEVLTNTNTIVASECSSFYHTKKLSETIKLLLAFENHLNLINSGYFLDYVKGKFRAQKTESNKLFFANYFKKIIQELINPADSTKLSKELNMKEKDLRNLSVYENIDLILKLPSKLIFDFLHSYIMHTSAENDILRSHQAQGHTLISLDNHEKYFKKEFSLFEEALSSLHLLSDCALTDLVLEFYSKTNWMFNKEDCPNKQLERLLDFCCYFSEVDYNKLLSCILSRMLLDGYRNKVFQNEAILITTDIVNFQDGVLDTIDSVSSASLQERNFNWLRNGIKQVCWSAPSKTLINFGSRHLGGCALTKNYKGILGFFIDLYLNENESFWSTALGETVFQEWRKSIKIGRLERLNENGAYVPFLENPQV